LPLLPGFSCIFYPSLTGDDVRSIDSFYTLGLVLVGLSLSPGFYVVDVVVFLVLLAKGLLMEVDAFGVVTLEPIFLDEEVFFPNFKFFGSSKVVFDGLFSGFLLGFSKLKSELLDP